MAAHISSAVFGKQIVHSCLQILVPLFSHPPINFDRAEETPFKLLGDFIQQNL